MLYIIFDYVMLFV